MSETIPDIGNIEYVSSFDTNDAAKVNPYKFVEDAYSSTGGFYTGEYLVPHTKEHDKARRRAISTYKNYVKPVVDSTIMPVFSERAMRSTSSKLFAEYLNDADNKGTNLQKLTKKATKYSNMHGVSFTVMDNHSVDEEITVNDAITNRLYPYQYIVTAEKVVSYGVDDAGRLSELIFNSGTVVKNKEVVAKFTKVNAAEFTEYYKDKDGNPVKISSRTHDLGMIPVISLYSQDSDCILPFPPAYDLCRQNWEIYNQFSEQRVVERNCAFSTLTIDHGGEESEINIDIGTDSVLGYGSKDRTLNKPEWIAPPSHILKNMLEIGNNSIAKLIESASILGATATKSDNPNSGKQLAYEFIGTNYAIKANARLAEEYEHMVSSMFEAWTGEVTEYVVNYNDTYVPSEVEISAKIENYSLLLSIDFGNEEMNKTIRERVYAEIAAFLNINDEPEG